MFTSGYSLVQHAKVPSCHHLQPLQPLMLGLNRFTLTWLGHFLLQVVIHTYLLVQLHTVVRGNPNRGNHCRNCCSGIHCHMTTPISTALKHADYVFMCHNAVCKPLQTPYKVLSRSEKFFNHRHYRQKGCIVCRSHETCISQYCL